METATSNHAATKNAGCKDQSRPSHACQSVSLYKMDLPSWQIPALDDGRELTKVSHLGGLLPAHLHRLDQISQVDLCQISEPEPVDVPVIHPLAELRAHQPLVNAAVMTEIARRQNRMYVFSNQINTVEGSMHALI